MVILSRNVQRRMEAELASIEVKTNECKQDRARVERGHRAFRLFSSVCFGCAVRHAESFQLFLPLLGRLVLYCFLNGRFFNFFVDFPHLRHHPQEIKIIFREVNLNKYTDR